MANEKQAASGTLKIARYDDELGKQGNLISRGAIAQYIYPWIYHSTKFTSP